MKNYLSIAFVEFIGCMLFHFVGSVSPTPIANGLILITLVYFTAKVSNAHLNPCVSLIFTCLGHINPLEWVLYSFMQISGAITGALLIAALVPTTNIRDYRPYLSGCFIPNSQLSYAQVFGWEAIGTFSFVLPIFAVVWYTKTKNGYGNTGPLIIGLSLFANALAIGQWTGAAFNPARVFASPTIFNCGSNEFILYYVLGEIAGAVAAVITIFPWYGININPWYDNKLSRSIKDRLEMCHHV